MWRHVHYRRWQYTTAVAIHNRGGNRPPPVTRFSRPPSQSYLEILMSYESKQSAVSRIWGAFGNCDDYRDLELTRASHKSFAAGELTVAGQHADRWVAEPLENKWDCLIGTLRLTGYKTANFQRPWCCSCALEMLASGLVQDENGHCGLLRLKYVGVS